MMRPTLYKVVGQNVATYRHVEDIECAPWLMPGELVVVTGNQVPYIDDVYAELISPRLGRLWVWFPDHQHWLAKV
jgi:hypothetical protein